MELHKEKMDFNETLSELQDTVNGFVSYTNLTEAAGTAELFRGPFYELKKMTVKKNTSNM